MTKRSIAKDFHRLQKNVSSFSNGEARVVDFDDELKSFQVELNIKGGYYKDGIFVFEVRPSLKYPHEAPEVSFKSQIFHPNIGDGYEADLVCLSLFDEWQETNDFEDVVQGMLFLLKNPELYDALNPLFCGLEDLEECFAKYVRMSLEGGEVEGMIFERNPGIVLKDETETQEELLPTCAQPEEISPGENQLNQVNSVTSTNIDSLALSENFPLSDTLMKISSREQLYRCGLFWVYNNFTNVSKNAKPSKGGCPKWLTRLAMVMFGHRRRNERNVNIFSRHLGNLQKFPFLQRALVWNIQ